MRRIAVINQKGGVGKTTSTVNLGMALARAGQRVLLIDLDPQAHLSLHLGIDPKAKRAGVYELLTGSTTIAKTRYKVANNAWVIGSSIDLAAAEVELVSVVGREVILRDLLDQHVTGNGRSAQYDYVLMDCPPSLSVLTLNGLCAAQEVLIPLQPHYLALQGLGKLLETVSLVSKRINPGLKVGGVVVCMYDPGTKLGGEVIDDVRTFFEKDRNSSAPWSGARVFNSAIRRNIKLAESPSYGQSIFDYAPDSNGAHDYEQLAREIHEARMASGRTPNQSEVASPQVTLAPAPTATRQPVAPKPKEIITKPPHQPTHVTAAPQPVASEPVAVVPPQPMATVTPKLASPKSKKSDKSEMREAIAPPKSERPPVQLVKSESPAVAEKPKPKALRSATEPVPAITEPPTPAFTRTA